jgi:hypothetical protein
MTADDLRAKVVEDRAIPGAWRVEKMDKDGGYEMFAIFAGPSARQNAVNCALQLLGALTRE